MTVEDELVLTADEIAECDVGKVVAGALDQHPLSLRALAVVVRGGGDVDDHLRAGECLVSCRRARLPDVLADREADRRAADPDSGRCAAGLEVALLVEYAVVRERHLSVDAPDLAIGEDRERVVDVLGGLGEPDNRDHVPDVGRDLG